MTELTLPLVLLFACSALTSYVATAIVRRGAERVGLVDVPDDRKIHVVATPRLGGIAIIFGFGFPLLLLAANTRAAELVSKNLTYLFAVLASGSLIVGLGVYDDLIGTNASQKFAVQFAAAFILVAFGFHFDVISLAGSNFDLGLLGLIASMIWIVGVMNAMNFIDGMDSLATVVSLTIACAFSIIAILRHDVFSLVIMTTLTGSLIGFYPWNKPPAKIFMGDTGALFIGLLLATVSIARPSKSPTALIIGGPMLALALPVIDTLIVMKQRFGENSIPFTARFSRVFTADRRHIHHILVARYGSPGKAILGIWLVTLMFAAAAVMTAIDPYKPLGYIFALVALLALFVLRYLPRRRA
ncbi:MAG TPA: MraY family glycosyltransferase [Thermoanaerobaculia bacterium]|jgi:UDP-GlcNAc:undecaprenyl-phosphate GlcNAc-1-phosphate transferase|nr:MraY family glycosyltransferase [Thermoanaerobaculia bacterium]